MGEMSFNYLGQVDQALPEESPFGQAPEASGAVHDLSAKRSHLIDVIASVTNGQLRVEWLFSQNIHRKETIEILAQHFLDELRAIIAHCTAPDVGGYSPSDFPDVELSQEDIDDLLEELAEGSE